MLAPLNATTEGAGASEDVGPALGRPLKRAKDALPHSLTARAVLCVDVLRAVARPARLVRALSTCGRTGGSGHDILARTRARPHRRPRPADWHLLLGREGLEVEEVGVREMRGRHVLQAAK